MVRPIHIAAIALAVTVVFNARDVRAEEAQPTPCNEDAMIVFDASGSMAGNVGQGIGTTIPRIDEARHALAEVLPSATRFRRVGLITYGPGPTNSATFISISSLRRTPQSPSCGR